MFFFTSLLQVALPSLLWSRHLPRSKLFDKTKPSAARAQPEALFSKVMATGMSAPPTCNNSHSHGCTSFHAGPHVGKEPWDFGSSWLMHARLMLTQRMSVRGKSSRFARRPKMDSRHLAFRQNHSVYHLS